MTDSSGGRVEPSENPFDRSAVEADIDHEVDAVKESTSDEWLDDHADELGSADPTAASAFESEVSSLKAAEDALDKD